MSNLSDYFGSRAYKPFKDFGVVTGSIDLELEDFGSFRVEQGNGDLTINVIQSPVSNERFDVKLFLHPNEDFNITYTGVDINPVDYRTEAGFKLLDIHYSGLSFDVSAQDSSISGVAISRDGTKMYTTGQINDFVYQYTLSTPFDISTASYDNVSLDLPTLAAFSLPSDLAFNKAGDRLYVVSQSTDRSYQFNLSTPFDISTATFSGKVLTSEDPTPRGIFVSTDGKFFYDVGSNDDRIRKFILSVPFELGSVDSVVTLTGDNLDIDTLISGLNLPQSIRSNIDGTAVFVCDSSSNDEILQYELSTNYFLEDNKLTGRFRVGDETTNPVGMDFSADGSKMYIVSGSGIIFQYANEIEKPELMQLITQDRGNVTLRSKEVSYKI